MFKVKVITAAAMKIVVLLDVTPYSLVHVYHHFRHSCCFHLQKRKMKEIAPVGHNCERVKVLFWGVAP